MVLVLAMLAGLGWADDAAGESSVALSMSVYCGVKSLVNGNVGLLIGFAVAIFGLYQLVQGKTGGGLLLIVGGALVTFVPNLIESALEGVSSVLNSSTISTDSAFKAPSCRDRSYGGGG